MKKLAAAAVAAVAVVVGAGVGVRVATHDSSSCDPPLTLLGSEQDASIAALEQYISENIAPTFKDPADLAWQSEDYHPTLKPNKIAAQIVVVNTVTAAAKHYHITLVRDCQGGDWKVVEFKQVQG